MNLIKKFCTENTTAYKSRKIEYIVIHYTAGITSSGRSDENTAAWFARLTTKASSDYIVDDDSVTQFNGDIRNRYTWNCRGSRYNNKGGTLYGVCKNANAIGVEICSNNSTGTVKNANDPSWYFTDATLDNAVELVRGLMEEYDIPPERVVRHYDVTGKLCPGIIGWNLDSGDEKGWLAFKERLSAPGASFEYEELKAKYDSLLSEYGKLESRLATAESDRDRYKGLIHTISELTATCT